MLISSVRSTGRSHTLLNEVLSGKKVTLFVALPLFELAAYWIWLESELILAYNRLR